MKRENDVRKILSELHSNRLNIENDRKSYDKVRSEIQQVEVNVSKTAEQWDIFSKKYLELVETISTRSSDVNILNIKNRVIDESCETLEKSIENCQCQLRILRKQLEEISASILKQSTDFAKEWNCSQTGHRYRQDRHDEKLSELQTFKKNLEDEMDNFLLMKRSVEYAEAEKLEIMKKFELHKEEAEIKEEKIRQQLEITNKELLSLHKKREELTSKDTLAQEFKRLSECIETTRKSISFLESRVSETQRLLENQKHESNVTVSRPSESYSVNPIYQNPENYEPAAKIRTLEHFTGPTQHAVCDSTKRCSNKPLKSSEYSITGPSKAPRMFQFKKKQEVSCESPSLEKSNHSQKTDMGVSLGFQNAKTIFLNSNSTK